MHIYEKSIMITIGVTSRARSMVGNVIRQHRSLSVAGFWPGQSESVTLALPIRPGTVQTDRGP